MSIQTNEHDYHEYEEEEEADEELVVVVEGGDIEE